MNTLSSNPNLDPIFKELETIIDKGLYDMWLRPAVFTLDGSNLIIQIPNTYWQQTIEKRYEQIIKDAFLKHTGQEITVSYTIKEIKDPVQDVLEKADPQPAVSVAPVIRKNPFPSHLNSAFSFENFIESPSNRFAYKTAQAVANKPGSRIHNPLFIYSTPGLGKTHLLHAIGNQICQNNPGAKVIYMTAEDFVAEYVDAIPTQSTDVFRRKYRSLDCLLMDDIQFVAGKSDKVSVQEFFHTFNALFENK